MLISFVSLLLLLTPPPSHMTAPEGFQTATLATEPVIQDPVAFWIDPDGRLLIAETERTEHGTMDNRSSPFWLDDDLQAQTVEDRLAYYKKWEAERETGMAFYREKPDRVRRSIDSDGDGVYDEFTIFAGPFNDVLDGIGSGVMTVDGEVWYTNIPNLWRLVDADGDGVAEKREPMHTGFGVRTCLYGHDMHGLVRGPDGRVYWSIGDRGYHVKTADGRVLSDPRAGAVFRCETDGSNLELYHTGLRNPQEIAFNAVGDLFAGDNNSDAGDKARIVFVAQDGETGWAMDYQTVEEANQRGPWNQEATWQKLSDANRALRPAWTLPPVGHVGAGPSGFAYYPGLGLPEKYNDHLFMCDFTGSRPHSSVWSFQAVPSGAGYEIRNVEKFLENSLSTDVMFDWDGRVLVSEWGSGWGATEKGFLHAAWHPERAADQRIAAAKALAIEGLSQRSAFEVADLLSHPDMRIRMRAQFELAKRGDVSAFTDVATYSFNRLAQLHAIWGLGQIARRQESEKKRNAALSPLVGFLEDPDPEIRAQSAKVLGDSEPYAPAADPLIELLGDDSPRVRYHAARTLGMMQHQEAIPFLVGVVMEDENTDPFLRHAVATALWRIGDEEALAELAAHPMPAVRLAAVLALRRSNDPSLERLVFDEDLGIALEAARAVHDKPIPEAMPALASLAKKYGEVSESVDGSDPRITPLLRRVISANQKLGGPAQLTAIAAIASNNQLPMVVRIEALEAMRDFESPLPRDRVLGWWRPVENAPRDREMISGVFSRTLPSLANDEEPEIRSIAIEVAGAYDVGLDPEVLFATAIDESSMESDRVACIGQLPGEDQARLKEAIATVMQSNAPAVRTAARQRLMRFDADAGETAFLEAINAEDLRERQAAVLALGSLDTDTSQAAIEILVQKLRSGSLDRGMQIDVVESAAIEDWWEQGDLGAWNAALYGGDPGLGQRLVRYHSGATCLRCHQIEGLGGTAGPALDGVAARLDREEILGSLITPQAIVVEEYGDASAMPNMRDMLTPREIRDVVAYLSTLQDDSAAEGH